MKSVNIFRFIYLLIIFSVIFSCKKEEQDTRTIQEKLEDLPGVGIQQITPLFGHQYAFQLDITQPLNHNNPDGPSFTQRAYLHHAGEDLPMVFAPSGYAVTEHSGQELAGILGCNMLTVTHRFFIGSEPDPFDWQYLTIEQSAADHHQIVSLLKKIYKGIWISSGASKSGQAVLFHRRFYPADVDATVAYVAPIVFGTKDPRFTSFLNQVGDAECRSKLETFERRMLTDRDSILPKFIQWFPDHGYTISLDINEAYEYSILEYHFAFWQFHNTPCNEIPDENATYQEMFDHFDKVMWLEYFSDYDVHFYEPYVYQALSETGYPVYITDYLSDLLLYATDPGADFYLVNTAIPAYNPEPIQDINNWLKNYGNNIIYIYGEYDPWSAAMFEPTNATNAIRVIQPAADHSVRIQNLDQRDLVMSTLEG